MFNIFNIYLINIMINHNNYKYYQFNLTFKLNIMYMFKYHHFIK